MGLGLTGVSFVAAPLAAIWLFISLWLGRKQVSMTREQQTPTQTPAGPLNTMGLIEGVD
jgi:hypothetical protein